MRKKKSGKRQVVAAVLAVIMVLAMILPMIAYVL